MRRWFWVLLVIASGCGDASNGPDGALPDGSPPRSDGGADEDAGRADGGRADGGPTDGGPVDGGPDGCGDGMCTDAEDCASCEADCGACVDPPVTECNDGIDNDGDGLTDWQMDVGCWSSADRTEGAGPRSAEGGYTTFDLSDDSRLVYVSRDGDDSRDGLTPETAVATPARGAELVRDGFPDFLLFRRGDTWRDQDLGSRVARRFKSGRDAEHPLVVGSYGDSTERPRFEIRRHFIDDDGHGRAYLAVVGLHFVSFRKVPGDPEFNGADGGAVRLVGSDTHDVLMEDNLVEYGEFVLQNGSDLEVRHNVVYRSYHVGTCATRPDGTPNPNGDPTFRPSGIFAGRVDGLLIEGNVWDENGWNPDVADACATIYNHDLYLSGCDRLVVRDNLILRASSIGLKMAANDSGASRDILIEGNVFAEGEIGLSMGGNDDRAYRFVDATVRNNVFTDIGRAQPTGRELSWYIDIIDNDGVEVVDNLLVNQPDLGNPRGIHLQGGTNRSVRIEDNLLYGLRRRAFFLQVGGWDAVVLDNNRLDAEGECIVDHQGGFGAVSYRDNAYRSDADAGRWFCIDGARRDLSAWQVSASEPGAIGHTFTPTDAGRNLDRYAESLSLGDSLADFAEAARTQSRLQHRPELTAARAAAYLREGYDFPRGSGS